MDNTKEILTLAVEIGDAMLQLTFSAKERATVSLDIRVASL